MEGQTLGVLFSERDWKSIINGTSEEQTDLYVYAADRHRLRVCFFRICDIDLRTQTVRAMIKPSGGHWERWRIRLPRVVHNRAIHRINTVEDQLRALRRHGVVIYNFWNNYGKLGIYQKIRKNSSLRRFLPYTCRFTKENLARFLRYRSFFLKPDRGSVGKGIVKVSRCSKGYWRVSVQTAEQPVSRRIHARRLFPFLKRHTGNRWHILQEAIDLLEYDGNPFDIRVSVQRDGSGKWQVTGMVGKVAPKGSYLSNVYQGGTVMELDKLLAGKTIGVSGARKELSEAVLQIARWLSRFLPNLADVGFDFGIAKDGRLYFIEMNCRDQRYSFRLANMLETFIKTYENPVAYGKHLWTRKTQSKLGH